VVPGPADDVVIGIAGITVTHASNVADAVHSLTSLADINISAGSVSLAAASTFDSTLELSGGTLTSDGATTVAGLFTWAVTSGSGGTLDGTGSVTLQGGLTVATPFNNTYGPYPVLDGVTLVNAAGSTATVQAYWDLTGSATIDNQAGATFVIDPAVMPIADVGPAEGSVFGPPSAAAPTFNNAGDVVAAANIGAGLYVDLNNTGTVDVQPGGSLGLTYATVNAGQVVVAAGGTLDWGGTTVTSTPSSSISGGGTVVFDSGSQATLQGTYNVTGTTSVIDSGSVTFDSPVQNVGTLEVEGVAGTAVTFAAAVTTVGPITMQLNAVEPTAGEVTTVQFGAAVATVGDVTLGADTVLNFLGNVGSVGTVTVGSAYYGVGLVDFAGASSPVTLAGLTINGGTVTDSDALVVSGPLSWTVTSGSGGTLDGTGSVTLQGGLTVATPFNNTYGPYPVLDGVTLINAAGSTAQVQASWDVSGTAAIDNQAGATFLFDPAAMPGVDVGPAVGTVFGPPSVAVPTFTNAGDLVAAASASGAGLIMNLDNTGTVDVQPGTSLGLSGATANAGQVVAEAGGTLDWGGPTVTSTPGSSIGGGGTVVFESPTQATLQGTYDVTGATTVSGGTVTFQGAPSGATLQLGNLTIDSGGWVNINEAVPGLVSATVNGVLEVGAGGALGSGDTTTITVYGAVGGDGAVNDNVALYGTLVPGYPDQGTFTVNGDLTEFSGSGTWEYLSGTAPGAGCSRLVVSGHTTLASALTVFLVSGFVPAGGASFTLQPGNGPGAVSSTFAGLPEGAIVWDSTGTYPFTISYAGGPGHDVVLTSRRTATTTVTSSANPSIPGQPVPFTATVTPPTGNPTPTGSVDFVDTTTNTDLGTATLSGGVATLTTSALGLGAHVIQANYGGDGTFLASSGTLTQTVTQSIVVLNGTASGALSVTGNASINIPGNLIVDSNSRAALTESGNAAVTAAGIQVVGGASQSGHATWSPAPVTGAASAPDPLAALAAPTTGVARGSVNLSGNSTLTINPGVYSSIKVSGNARLTLTPGVYVLAGGGFTVSGNGSLSGSGVTLYDTQSNFPGTGGTFGGLTLSGNGTFNLTAPTSGPYAGVVVFQNRGNTRAISLSGNAAEGLGGTVYAPAALLYLSGNASLAGPVVVNELSLTGNAGSTQAVDGADVNGGDAAGQLLAGDLEVYVNDPAGLFTSNELARIQDAVNAVDAAVEPCGISVTETTDPTVANVTIDTGATSAVGGYADGILGCYTTAGEITLIQGWNWYAGTDPTQIGATQYDFQTTLTHELGHALGLGESSDPTSAMYGTLAPATAIRSLTTADLAIPYDGGSADAQRAALPPPGGAPASAVSTPAGQVVGTGVPSATPATAVVSAAPFASPGSALPSAPRGSVIPPPAAAAGLLSADVARLLSDDGGAARTSEATPPAAAAVGRPSESPSAPGLDAGPALMAGSGRADRAWVADVPSSALAARDGVFANDLGGAAGDSPDAEAADGGPTADE
jgi:hypothetical protein